MFDVLGQQVLSSRVLDLFAGTGAFGFEALSRGASKVAFVELNSVLAQIVRRNARELGIADRISVRVCGAAQALKAFDRSQETFTVIFIDPPYDSTEINDLWQQPALKRVIAHGGLLVVESRHPNPYQEPTAFLRRCFSRKYGDTLVEMYRLGEGE